MRFLLDTNTVIAVMAGNAAVFRRLRRTVPGDVAMPSIVLFELRYGAFNSARVAANLARVDALPFPVIDFDAVDAGEAGRVRAMLRQHGTPIGPYDVMIAGQALARDLTVVTNNVREFARVDGLRVEDWTVA